MENSISEGFGLLIIIAAVVLAIFWLIFPITVWQQLNKIEKHLRQISKSTEQQARDTNRLAEFFSERNIRLG